MSKDVLGRLAGWVARKPAGLSQGLAAGDGERSGEAAYSELDDIAATLGRASEEMERLDRELKLRTRELSEALQQQEATAEAIKAISRPDCDLQTVLDALVKSAAKLSTSGHAAIYLRDGEMLCSRASIGAGSKRELDQPLAIDRTTIFGRVMLSGQVEFIPDAQADPHYDRTRLPAWSKSRALMAVPLVRQGQVEGVLSVGRAEPGVFAAGQSECLQSFADQAVIAIENARLIEEEQARTRELSATSEILRAISRSAADVQPVFDAVARSARRLCDGQYSLVLRFDGSHLHFEACDGLDPHAADALRRAFPLKPGRDSAGARAVLSGAVEQIPDVGQDPEYVFSGHAKMLNTGSVVAVPMLREGTPVGAIVLGRTQTGRFPDRQVKLLQTFADEAAIAIGNTRLIEEEKARRRELDAAGEVLRAISRFPTDVQPVFEAIAQSVRRLCNAHIASALRFDGSHLHFTACDGLDPHAADAFRRAYPLKPGRDSASARAVLSGVVEQIPDVGKDPDYVFGELSRKVNTGSVVAVPMLREGTPIGAIVLDRTETGLFPDHQVKLLQAFADKAVIALENVRLFEEVQARNRDLTEALEQQAATAEILRAISAAPTDVQPVFEAIVRNAVSLCSSLFANVFRFDGELLHWVASHNVGPSYVELVKTKYPMRPDSSQVSGRVLLTKSVVRLEDALADADYDHRFPQAMGWRRMLGMPLLCEGNPLGVIVVGWAEPGPIAKAEEELLKTFADQAVIAITNVRLFEEVRARNRQLTEALEQQTATGAVLRAIAASPTDVQPVLDAVAESAARLCEAYDAVILLKDGDTLSAKAHHGPIPIASGNWTIGRDTVSGRSILDGAPVHIHDVMAAADEFPMSHEFAVREGQRTVLAVPLLREAQAIGALVVRRLEVQPFSRKQIELLTTFADEAVIAIANVRLFEEVQARNRQLTEALEQQTATGAILRAIAASPTQIQPVLDAVAESAARLCEAFDSIIFLKDGDALAWKAHHGAIPLDFASRPIARDWVTGRAFVDRAPVHVHDARQAAGEFPATHGDSERLGHRTLLALPLMREQEAIGALVIRRLEVRPFSQQQIDLLTTFADQAVIAIENVRLFEQVQARTRELQEALDHQTATGEVLNVISRSTSQLQPVLDAIVETAVRLCEADFALVFMLRDGLYHLTAANNATDELVRHAAEPLPPGRGSLTGRTALEARTVHIPDVLADPEYTLTERQKIGNYRAMLGVPLLRGGEVIGTINLVRTSVRPFTDKQIALVTTFADQAVIAIENVRLFEQVQARTRELQESLDHQTATGEVLNVISRSPTELQPVLDVIIETAARLCEADGGTITRRRDGHFILGGQYGFSAEFNELVARAPVEMTRGTITGRTLVEGEVVHILDAEADPEYTWSEALELGGGIRTGLGVPLLRDGVVTGAIALARRTVRPFTDKQIELVTTFADQAVIAIENVRLFEEVQARTRELQESLDHQTATGEVLNVISRSPTELQPVLDVIIETAVRLCEADAGTIARKRDGQFIRAGQYGFSPEFTELMTRAPVEMTRGSITGRTLVDGTVVHVLDAEADPDYTWSEALKLSAIRTGLGVPLLREGVTIGSIALIRRTVRPFTDKQIELLTTFADQAVIAIENVRLFEEVQARNRDLTEALEQQTATSEILRAIAASPTDIQPVLTAVAESAAKLCEAYDAAILLKKGDALALRAHHGPIPIDFDAWPVGRDWVTGRAFVDRRPVHVRDLIEAAGEFPAGHAMAVRLGHRTILAVPLLREDEAIGALVIRRQEVRPFTAKQIDLLTTFADQAVIAIENVRLFEEVQARNRDLTEALEQQTATSAILRAIAASPTDIQPVLTTVAESAAKLCEAYDAAILLKKGDALALRAHHGPIPIDFDTLPIGRDTGAGRAFVDRKPVHVDDVLEAAVEFPAGYAAAVRQGHRTILAVPLLREDEAIGVLVIRRLEVRPFGDKQIDLLTTFADQAVIAIENVRLFEEVQARNRDLTEALEQQTATSSILRAIAASPTDIQPVLTAVAESAARLCDAYDAVIQLKEGGLLALRAHHGPIPIDFDAWPIGRDTGAGRAFVDRKPVHVDDVLEAAAEFPTGHAMAARLGHRTILAVPLLREEEAIGALVIRRLEVRPFSSKQIDLLTTFADQAVIAIENVRLFEEVQARTRELQESLDYQTATGEVLNVISRSPTELQPVLDIIIETAVRLCEADAGTIDRHREGQLFRYGGYGFSSEFNELMTRAPVELTRGTITGRTFVEGNVVHVLDVEADPEYTWSEALELGGMRTALGVPLLREGVATGVIALIRRTVRPFTDKQIELVTTFADQAVIAIENVRLFEEVQARNRDLTEALEQQTATGAILRAIAASPTDIQPVLTAVAESAAKLCEAYDAAILLRKGDALALRAHHGPIPIDVDTVPIERDWVTGRAFVDRRPVHVHDLLAAADEFPAGQAAAARQGHRTILAVPLLREDEAIGALVIRRQEVRPFTGKQIDLLTTFADQAVIAIENVRLFDEVKVRTGELSEALQQQTATADVLKAISRSTFDLPVVLRTLTASAVRLCGASYGGILLRQGELLHVGAAYGGTAEDEAELIRHPLTIDRRTVSGRVALSGQVEHIADILTDPEYDWPFKGKFSDTRALMGVPLLHEGRVEGAFFLGRPEPGAFSSRQNEIVQTFADQAVIAIKNVRLFDEVQARTRELTDALQQQTATAEVLQVISRATFDLQTVLDTLVESMARLCEADHAWLFRRDADEYRWAASYGFSHEQHEQMKKILTSQRIVPGRASIIGRVALEGELVHVTDVTSDPEYEWRELQSVGGYRTAMGVPLLREGVPIGVMTVTRLLERPFTDRQIGLMQTFADQAVIAIENVRLFEEVRSRTAELARSVGELQALGEVSQAVNSTLDLKTVLETIVAKAVQLSETDAGAIYVYSKSADKFRLRATYGMSAELIEEISRQSMGLHDPGPGEAAQRRAPVQVADLREESKSPAQEILLAAGFRSFLVVPLLRPGKVVGALVVRRRTPGRFSDATVHLLETFAAQSVLAIQNARLFSEIEEKGHQLEVASRHKSQFLANMSHELRTPLNSVLGFTEMLADGLYGELPEKARTTLARVQANGRHLLGLINDVLDLSKIEAGQLTLTIEDYSIGQIVRTVTATTEPLAREKGLKLSAIVAEGLPMGRGDERRLSQVLLNLVGNAVKFTEQGSIDISAEERDGSFQVLVRDTGPGIAPEHQKRIFEEFQQVDESSTRQKGGTGLGLAISKRIIEMHGGAIGLDSELGRGSTFRVVVPVRAAEKVEAA